jgi:hypothetical protein
MSLPYDRTRTAEEWKAFAISLLMIACIFAIVHGCYGIATGLLNPPVVKRLPTRLYITAPPAPDKPVKKAKKPPVVRSTTECAVICQVARRCGLNAEQTAGAAVRW